MRTRRSLRQSSHGNWPQPAAALQKDGQAANEGRQAPQAENGWNNAANLWRTVREFEQAGICGVRIEDHERGKHTPVPPVIAPLEQVLEKIRAALDARQDPNFLVIARTDVPWAYKDVEEAVLRMNAYTEAGADLVMPAGMNPEVLRSIRGRVKGNVLITDTPGSSAADEQAAGADVVLHYGFC